VVQVLDGKMVAGFAHRDGRRGTHHFKFFYFETNRTEETTSRLVHTSFHFVGVLTVSQTNMTWFIVSRRAYKSNYCDCTMFFVGILIISQARMTWLIASGRDCKPR
jgi:hypothetical protein